MSDTEFTHLRLRVTGRVQGISYRDFVVVEARRLGLDGWVRNRGDGSVEVRVSGEEAPVNQFVMQCMKGPPGAQVRDVEMQREDQPADKGFRRRPTL